MKSHWRPLLDHIVILVKNMAWFWKEFPRESCVHKYITSVTQRSLAEGAGVCVSFYSGKEICCTETLGTYHYGEELQI